MTGFADAAGSFTYSRSGNQIALYFAIKQSASDLPLLEDIREFFGVGKIYSVKAPSAGFAKTASYYRVTHRKDLPHVLAHFDEYPLKSSKQKIYEVWRLMVQLKVQFRNPDREALNALAARLSSRVGRSKSQR